MKLNLPSADQHEVFFAAKTIKRDLIAEHHLDNWASLRALALLSCLLQHSALALHSYRYRRKGCSRPTLLGQLWSGKEQSNGSAFRLRCPATNYRDFQEVLHRKLCTPHLLVSTILFFSPPNSSCPPYRQLVSTATNLSYNAHNR